MDASFRKNGLRAAMAAGAVAAACGAQASELAVDLNAIGTLHPGFRIERQGRSVTGAGDVNGDGLADVAFGRPFAYPNPGSRAFIVFGRPEQTPEDPDAAGFYGITITKAEGEEAWFGHSVSGVGDVNGDGLADLIVGAHEATPIESRDRAGECYVIFGRSDAATIDVDDLGGAGFRILGAQRHGEAGASVSGAGDVNGDGLADLIVGAPLADAGDSDEVGESYVVFGKADTFPVDLASLGDGGFRITGEGLDDDAHSGTSVSGAGDVNGDGFGDVLVGSPSLGYSSDQYEGACFVVFGKADGGTVALADMGDEGFLVVATRDSAKFGQVVSGIGDVNGDGLADIGVTDGRDFSQSAFVVFGRTGTETVIVEELGDGGFGIHRIDEGDYQTRQIAGAGDVNGDGFADVLVGAPYVSLATDFARTAGESCVIFGGRNLSDVDVEVPGSTGIRIGGTETAQYSGRSVSCAGDVDGDGLSDLCVSSYEERHVVFAPVAPAVSAVCRAGARAGNAPRVAVGICGDGSDDDSPSTRCWIDFDGGQGQGSKGSSLQTVTLTRNDLGIRVFRPEHIADVRWHVASDRTGWRKARVTLQYTDAEIAGLREETLRVWRASSPRGPWALYSHGMVREPQRNRIGVTVPALGYFVIEGERAP